MICQGWRYSIVMMVLFKLLAGCQAVSADATPSEPSHTATFQPPPHARIQRLPSIDEPFGPVRGAPSETPAEELPFGAPPRQEHSTESTSSPNALQLEDVITSVQESYPLLVSVMLERQIAVGKQLAAWGEFDLRMKVDSIAGPEGFYKTYRNRVSADQPLFGGGYLYGGYKIGRGSFQPWFKERETDEGGEFSVGMGTPLLQGRAIDKRRSAVFQADLARQAVEPAVRAELLEFVRVASQVYWSWVAAGQALEAQRELLRNAQARIRQIEERVKAGDLERIARINNEQLIAARETKVIESERKLQQAAIKLSLFFRNVRGEPVVPGPARLPTAFPGHALPYGSQVNDDIAIAVNASPELRELDLVAQQVRVELQNAENMLLPKLDALIGVSKDVGGPASTKRDKTPLELEAGFYGEVPLQRREARGKVEAARGKLAQIDAKRQFVVNKIAAAVQDAVSALEAAAGRIDRAQANLRLARETLALGRAQFAAGDVTLIELNIYEKSVTEAQLLLVASQADFFSALADYRAALALDPLASE